MKKNFVSLIFLLLLLTGCGEKYDNNENKIIYNLNVGSTFKENIVFTYSNDLYKSVRSEPMDNDLSSASLEYWLLYGKINPINSFDNIFYDKKIIKNKGFVNAVLDYEYLETDFLHSNFIMQCFENYDLSTYEDYFVINLSGEYFCWDDKEVEINVTSDYTIVDSNGESINNKYIWSINKDNYEDVDIYYKVYRNYNGQLKKRKSSFFSGKVFDNLKYIFGIIVIIIMFFGLFKIYKKSKND